MSNPIRVLQVIGQMNRGGAETMIMNIYRQIDKSKIQFDFVVHTNKKGDYDDEIIKLGGRIYNVPRFTGTNIYIYTKAWKRLFNNNKGYKVIHGHIGSCASIYLKIAKTFGLFTIAHSHSVGTRLNLRGIIYSCLSYPTRYIADYFFGCSELAGISRYGKSIVNSYDRFSVLKNAINIENFTYSKSIRSQKRSELNIENKFILGHIGRFDEAKNQSFLIDIFKEVHDKKEKSGLILIGDGKLRESAEEKVKNLGLSDSVIFTGVRSDISELLQAIDVFVFPSLYEGLPVTLVEAQASGTLCFISENITNEVKVTDLIRSISLEKSPQEWAVEILNVKNGYKRCDTSDEIRTSGFDIRETTKMLENFYIEKSTMKGKI